MAQGRDGLLQKFASLRAREGSVEKALRRSDFKGTRGRLNLRVPLEVLVELQLLKTASGMDKNEFCVGVLAVAIRREVDKLKAGYDAAGWEIVARCAKRSR